MELKMLTGLSGPALSLSPRDTHEFNLPEAIRLVDAGFAEPTDRKAYDAAAAELAKSAGKPDDAAAKAKADAESKAKAEAEAAAAAEAEKAAKAAAPTTKPAANTAAKAKTAPKAKAAR